MGYDGHLSFKGTMGYDGHLSFKGESFPDFIIRTWHRWSLPPRELVVSEFYDVRDGVLYVAGCQKKNDPVLAFIVKDGGEAGSRGEVFRFARCFWEEECPVFAFPPAQFLRLLTGAAKPSLAGEMSWRETAALNAEWGAG
jgi:hypothetical protein